MTCWKSVIERNRLSISRTPTSRGGSVSACTCSSLSLTVTELSTETGFGSRENLTLTLILPLPPSDSPHHLGRDPEADVGGLGPGRLQQLVVGDGGRAGGPVGGGGAVVTGERHALHVGPEVVDADLLPVRAGVRLVVLDADLDVVQFPRLPAG